MSACIRCSGTGKWINPKDPSDLRECFACAGTGIYGSFRPAPPQAPPPRTLRSRIAPRKRDYPGDEFFVGVQLGESDTTSEASATNSATLDDVARCVRNELTQATTKLERDIKGWTQVELDVMAQRIEQRVLAQLTKRLSVTIELTRNGVTLPQVEGHQHPAFVKLLRLATSRDASGFVPNIWMTGPAGSGKTTGARMLARALELPFFYNGALETKFEVIGYNDAGGAYHTTAFRQAMERPSVYLFDDIDSCDSNAPLLALNGALANGLIAFPDAHVERHPDSIVIATANTWGLGATADYVGRQRLDGAFTDRFGGKIAWGYDEEFERAIAGNVAWTERVQRARHAAAQAGLKVLITPRASIAGAAYIAAGFSADEAADMTYLANLSADQRRMLQ